MALSLYLCVYVCRDALRERIWTLLDTKLLSISFLTRIIIIILNSFRSSFFFLREYPSHDFFLAFSTQRPNIEKLIQKCDLAVKIANNLRLLICHYCRRSSSLLLLKLLCWLRINHLLPPEGIEPCKKMHHFSPFDTMNSFLKNLKTRRPDIIHHLNKGLLHVVSYLVANSNKRRTAFPFRGLYHNF